MQINENDALKSKNRIDPRQWVAKYADYLYGYSFARINDEDLARDLVQDTFLAALEKEEKFEGKSSESTWLTAILKNKIIDVYRKRAKVLQNNPRPPNYDIDEYDFFDSENGHWQVQHQPKVFGMDSYDPLASKEFNSIIQKCMQKLPGLWLSVFTMKHLEDEPTEKICRELQLTPNNFWVIIHRTKINLRACLQKNWI